ncbi:solute carrier family 22 member 3-like isoform X2 [Ornithodoros turicata]|uniref:solute carrier family 22 member 3-like isoform X2 n=1 Tax=Ornithodoros turicata TaxID=34597 RepID=UPI003138FE5A
MARPKRSSTRKSKAPQRASSFVPDQRSLNQTLNCIIASGNEQLEMTLNTIRMKLRHLEENIDVIFAAAVRELPDEVLDRPFKEVLGEVDCPLANSEVDARGNVVSSGTKRTAATTVKKGQSALKRVSKLGSVRRGQRQSRSVLRDTRTPGNSHSVPPKGVITPKFDTRRGRTPSLTRKARPGEVLLSLSGSPVRSENKLQDKTAAIITLGDGKFDLVCGRQWMIHLLDIVFAIGALAADITMGKMGDRCGRYPVIYANVLLLLIAGLVTIFMHKFPGFVVCQFFVAFGLESMLNTGIVLLSEVTDSKDRCLVIVACFVVWGTAYLILLPLLGFLENWIVAQVSIMIPTMLLFVGLTVVVESPRFLIAVRNYEEAEAVIMYAVKKNRINQEWASIKWRSTLDDICHASPIGPTYPGVNTLLLDRNNRKLLKMTTCLIVSWFVTSLMDNVIHFSFDGESTESVTVDTVAVGLLVQLLAFGFTMLTVNRSGRCIAMSSGLFIAGVAHLLAVSLQHSMAVLAASKVFTVGVSNVLYVYTVEIFPTVIRSRAFSACTLSGHIGGLVASLGAELKSLISHTMWIMLVLSFVCILNSALVLNLPETKDRDLPDNFDDIEDLFGPFKRIKRLSESRRISDAFRKRTTLDMNNASPLTPLSTTTSPSQEIISENRIQPKAPRIIMPSTSPHADLPR